PVTRQVVRTNLGEHPAVQAWSALGPERIEPDWIETLHMTRKSAVYRLAGIGPGGSAVIAKRCSPSTAVIERTVYQEVLPRLPIPALRYFGSLNELDSGLSWQFLEDAGEDRHFSLISGEDRGVLAAQHLALMHTSAARISAPAELPDRGTNYSLGNLQNARETIQRNFGNPRLQLEDLAVLEAIVSQCNFLEGHWVQVEEFCQCMPNTLVHGDFQGNNVRVRPGPDGRLLLLFDWEFAGWGVPACDLWGVDTFIYWAAIREEWPQVDLADIRRLAEFGRIFWWLATVFWESLRLPYEYVERPMRYLRSYVLKLSNAIQVLEWRG
ncbi:MAG TPA: aminoglycoside phosphotransferase family protein, partial [Dehalococcoidia bacterium]|nr:aminoglycoside phosphotransferase family protein [Dehalococcoidia bacterium]